MLSQSSPQYFKMNVSMPEDTSFQSLLFVFILYFAAAPFNGLTINKEGTKKQYNLIPV